MSGQLPENRLKLVLNLQRWESLTFLHWPIEPSEIAHLIPPPLELDVFEGAAWIGITPFSMSYVGTPAIRMPLVRSFVEINVRTYVRAPDGRDGIWFFSLECPRIAVIAGLRLLGLPYVDASAVLNHNEATIQYASRRRSGGAAFWAAASVGGPIPRPDALTTFLTGRWNAFTRVTGSLVQVPIEHEPWPLHHANARANAGELLAENDLPAVTGEPLAHFSPAVHVRIGCPRRD